MKKVKRIFKKKHKAMFAMALAFISLSSCHNSYYQASTKNANRLDGEDQKTALALVEINDYFMLIEKLGKLTENKATKKDTYLVAIKMRDDFRRLSSELELRAVFQKVVLPDELSKTNDLFYQKAYALEEDVFDEEFREMLLEKLKQLKNVLTYNLENPIDDHVQSLSNQYLDEVRIAINEVKSLQS
ncbi:MAG: hypothetical protein JXR03_04385 [Cyclobacteriaceae bacterium]